MQWSPETRTLLTGTSAVVFSEMQARIFDVLWRSRQSGQVLGRDELTARAYAHDPDGGPDSDNCVSVHINNMRKRMAGSGLMIVGWTGRGGGVRLIGARETPKSAGTFEPISDAAARVVAGLSRAEAAE